MAPGVTVERDPFLVGQPLLTICTGWSPTGWHEYGEDFLRTFRQFSSSDIQLLVYAEEDTPLPGAIVHQVRNIHGCGQFLERHEGSDAARGREPKPWWKERAIRAGYNWRFDAVKFSRQAFIPEDAAFHCGTSFLAWFDGDVRFTAPFSAREIISLLPHGQDVAYLGRPPKHSEIGFQLYRLPQALPLLRMFRQLYSTDEVFKLKEWHSAYAWDWARERSNVAAHNLTPNGTGHVWHASPLRRFSDHLKGDRKRMGASPERRR